MAKSLHYYVLFETRSFSIFVWLSFKNCAISSAFEDVLFTVFTDGGLICSICEDKLYVKPYFSLESVEIALLFLSALFCVSHVS